MIEEGLEFSKNISHPNLFMDHFNVFNEIVKCIDDFTVPGISASLIYYGLIGLLFFSCLTSKFNRIIISSTGGAYISAYIVFLIGSFSTQLEALAFFGGFWLFYFVIYFIYKPFRKLILNTIISGWCIFCGSNMATKGRLMTGLYSNEKDVKIEGTKIIVIILISCLVFNVMLGIRDMYVNRKIIRKQN